MADWIRRCWRPLLILAVSLATRFVWLTYPADVVWDEQHFTRYTNGYLKGRYFFDVHPPLGKLLIFAALKLAGAQPSDFHFTIGAAYPPHYPYLAGRLLPAVAGSLLPWIVYLLARRMRFSPLAALAAGLLLAFDNALLAESRIILIDIFVHFFAWLALWLLWVHLDEKPWSLRGWLTLLGCAGAAGCSMSVKWTGVASLGVAGLVCAVDAVRTFRWTPLAVRGLTLLLVPAGIYVACFAAHFALLPLGRGDGDAYMSGRFRDSLRPGPGEPAPGPPMGFWERFAELNTVMWTSHTGQELRHGESSRFYQWPVGRKSIYYWVESHPAATEEVKKRRIYQAPNLAVWMSALIGVAGGAVLAAARWRRIRDLWRHDGEWRYRLGAAAFLLLVYTANWVPFIPIHRAMFIYHYFTALVASVLLGVWAWVDLAPVLAVRGWGEGRGAAAGAVAGWTLIGLSAAMFVFLSPITYGYVSPLGILLP